MLFFTQFLLVLEVNIYTNLALIKMFTICVCLEEDKLMTSQSLEEPNPDRKAENQQLR